MNARKGTEFAVPLANRPGSFAELSKKLATRDINIKAFMLYTNYVVNVPGVPQVAGICKMIVEEDEESRKILRDLGIKFSEEEVLLLSAPDEPGILATVLGRLAEAGLNVKEGYTSTPFGQADVLIVLAVNEVQEALALVSHLELYSTVQQKSISPN